jgi:hypothetical protein
MDAGAGGQRPRPAPSRALVGLLVPAALAVGSAVLGWAASAPLGAVRAPGPAPVDALLALGAALGCAALLALAAVGATLSLAAVVTGQVAGRLGALARLLTPRVVRGAVGLAVGVSVVSGNAGYAIDGAHHPVTVAVTAASTQATTAPSPATPHVSGGRDGQRALLPPDWSPDRPAATSPGTRAPAVHPVASEPHRQRSPAPGGAARSERGDRAKAVVVQAGDTLWGIAAHHLGASATAAQIAVEWPRWHAANRSTIGPDPDLILPGQRLASPPSRPTE